MRLSTRAPDVCCRDSVFMQRFLELKSELSELRRMSTWLREQMRETRVNDSEAYLFELCANEAVANIILHAQGAPAGSPIGMTYSVSDSRVELRIEDQSRLFDPMSAPLPEMPLTLDDALPGGKGLVLLQKLLPRSRYERHEPMNLLVLSNGS